MNNSWFPFHVNDFLAETLTLSAEEIGAYILMQNYYWKNGGAIEKNEKLLKKITKISAKKLQNILVFFEEKDGKLHHKELDAKLKKFKQNSNIAKQKAAKRWDAAAYAEQHAQRHASQQCESRIQNPDIELCKDDSQSKIKPSGINNHPISFVESRFEEFWKEYPRTDTGKKRGFEKYRLALKKTTHEQLVAAAIAYRAWCLAENKPLKFIKHAATWLNGEEWNSNYEPVLNDVARDKKIIDEAIKKVFYASTTH